LALPISGFTWQDLSRARLQLYRLELPATGRTATIDA